MFNKIEDILASSNKKYEAIANELAEKIQEGMEETGLKRGGVYFIQLIETNTPVNDMIIEGLRNANLVDVKRIEGKDAVYLTRVFCADSEKEQRTTFDFISFSVPVNPMPTTPRQNIQTYSKWWDKE